MRFHALAAAAAAIHLTSFAQGAEDITALRTQLQQLRQDYEARLRALEQRLDAAEKAQAVMAAAPPPAAAPPSPTPEPVRAAAPALAVSAVLTGSYAHLRKDPDTYRIQGFIPAGEGPGPGQRGFGLGESEITLAANVDPYFLGRLTFALTPEGTAEVEEAYVRTTALADGLSIAAGRLLSGLGYLNAQHAHAWDFVDAPLAYQAFFGGQYKTEGMQLKWIAPTETYLELAAELGNGNAFPGHSGGRNGAGSALIAAHAGGDWGARASWRTGASLLQTKSDRRAYEDADGTGTAIVNAFSGHSRTAVLDGVVKWAPSRGTSLKLQGEYLWRRETGTLDVDLEGATLGPSSTAYRSRQSGWYVQGVYQFAPAWRVGLRYDRLRSGTPTIGLVGSGALTLADFPRLAPHAPRRLSAMADYSLTEFSRLRLQLADDRAQPGRSDRQLFLQYIMSLGAHGAHTY